MDPPSNKSRLPFANVSNNVNHSSQRSLNVDVPEELHRNSYSVCNDDSFFMFRKTYRKPFFVGTDPFAMLSDEVLLQIFKWLPKKTLLTCGEVNHRFNRVTKDETLWYRLDLSNRRIKVSGLSEVLSRNAVVLRMAQTSVLDPPVYICPDIPQQVKLQYLDLSMCQISKSLLRALLAACRGLLKLSLENVPLDGAICEEIAENRNLDTLNLTMCLGIDATGMRTIAKSLTKLHSLNVAWTYLSQQAVKELFANISPHILHLNIAGCRTTLSDDALASLMKRCPRMLSLDLSDCSLLSSEAIQILCKSRKLEYLSLSRCYNINITSYLLLAQLKTLRYLDLFGLLSVNAIDTLKKSLGDVGINKYYHSSVARPTVGSKRTSIWGIRTRE
ncbi:S-phase kinase-associated protein 2 [Anopheles nili]|uniref:S-phase kinase-associated protein 2 n=1 Tax=Anopheles nili TaxID=185578 RepID=UPI00237BCC4E|nr:S-phase kinase-associated protein 2 [Anopheles nili]